MNQPPRKMLFIGGENQAHPIMEAGEHYVEIPDRRFSWPNWDLMLDPTRPRAGTSGQLSGRDMAGIAQCTAKAGRLVLDKVSRPDGSRICIAWAADGRLRIIQELTVEELSPLQRASHRATLAQENTEAVAANGQDMNDMVPRWVEKVIREKEKADRRKREEDEKRRAERRAENNLPKWREEERRFYDAKILDLIREGMTNRQIAGSIPAWAKDNPNVKEYRIPSDSTLQIWAAIMRGKRKRRKRAH